MIAQASKKSFSNLENMTRLGALFCPGPFDVICARGKEAKNHSGNMHFRRKIVEARQLYADAKSRIHKSIVVSSVVDFFREASPNGGFVKEINGVWYEVGEHLAREKVGQSLREQLHSQYKSSTKAKRRRIKNAAKQNEMKVQHYLDSIVQSSTDISNIVQEIQSDQKYLVDDNDVSDESILDFFTQKNSAIMNTIMYDPKLQQGVLKLTSMTFQ